MSKHLHTRQNWHRKEIDLIVADYFTMLNMELRGQGYVKSNHNAELQRLTGRSRGSIEFKLQNISAVLWRLGHPWVQGYKPMMNFQKTLLDGVKRFLDATAGNEFALPEQGLQLMEDEPLYVGAPPAVSERPEEANTSLARLVRKFDPAARDERNRRLGRLGEERALKGEHTRLRAAGREDLARRVRWVSEEDGDGAGYDILSFSETGEERFLEVKTTPGASTTPFFITDNEKKFSDERPKGFRLFRIYDFAKKPKAFLLKPPLEDSLIMRAGTYRASFR